MEKKLISLLLAVLMMFSALPITVFAAESEYPESEHPYGIGEFKWVYDGNPGTKSLSVTFSDKTKFDEYSFISFYNQNGDWLGNAGSEISGKTIDFNASSLQINLNSWNSSNSYYGFKITNIRENNYEVDETVIPGEDCKITEDRTTGTITFEPIISESEDDYISLSYNVLGSYPVKWVKRIVVKSGFNNNDGFNAFVNAEVLDFAEDFDFRGYDISETAFYKNKSNWDHESLYLDKKLIKLGENDKIKENTVYICSSAIPDNSEDVIIPNSVEHIGTNYDLRSIICTKGSYAQLWAEYKCIDYTCIGDLKIKFKNCIISKGTPLSSAIEVYKLYSDYTWKQIPEYSSSGYSSSKVGAQTVTISDGESSLDFTIMVSNDDNQYINFNDKYLRGDLYEADLNDDGVITVDEMRAYTGDILLYRVRDLSGLEYADSASYIYFWGDRLISLEEYFSLQKYNDITIPLSKIKLGYFESYGRLRLVDSKYNIFKDFTYKSSNNNIARFDSGYLNLIDYGDAEITITFGSISKSFTIHVDEPDYYKDLGESATQVPALYSGAIINTPNGDVYEKTHENFKKVNSKKSVLMSTFYPGRYDIGIYASVYYITSDNALWKSENKVGDNFKKITNPRDYYGLALDYEGNCYSLQDFELIAKDVKDINGSYYLKRDGSLYKCEDKKIGDTEVTVSLIDNNVRSIIKGDYWHGNYYIKEDGKTYSNGNLYIDHEIKDAGNFYDSTYYIDNDDSLWILGRDGTTGKVASDVVRVNDEYWNHNLFSCQTKNGDYYIHHSWVRGVNDINYDEFSTPILTNVKKLGDSFYLDKNNDLYAVITRSNQICSRRGILAKIMTNVVDFNETIDTIHTDTRHAIFTRTDGSVWSYTVGDEEPIKLLEGEDYTPEHTHTFNHITVPSTCKVAGMEYDICSECGETFNEKTLPLAAHTWSEWTVEKEATTTAEGQEKRTCSACGEVETRAIEKLKALIDEKTGVEINYNDEYEADTEIKVEEQFSGKSFQLLNTEFGKVNSKIYDIATYKDGVKVQPDGEITVKIPLPDGFTTNKVFVCYVDSVSGKVTKIPCDVKDGYVTFKTNHFSEYAIVEQLANVKSVSIGDITMNYKKSAKINPTIAADEGAEYTVKYSSSNASVARVDDNGNVYGAKRGSATITCTVTDSNGNTVQDTCKVTVKYSFGQWLIKILLFGWIWY